MQPIKLPHKIPNDLKKVIESSKKAKAAWESITPLAKNEFICWVEDAKNESTRVGRIERTLNDLINGKRRPCCWIGCIHRSDKKISPSVQWVLNKKSKSKS